jgi:TldD protein
MNLATVESVLLQENGLSPADLDVALQQLFQHRLDFADIYLQFESSEVWSMEESIVKEGSFSIAKGLGVRAVHGEKTGFAYADHISLDALKNCVVTARNIVMQGQSGQVKVRVPQQFRALYPAHNPIHEKSHLDKVAFLREVDAYTRSLDPRVIQVMASLSAHYELVLIAASDGTYAADIRPLVRMNVSVVMEDQGRHEQGYSGGGGRKTYAALCEDQTWQHYAREAVRIAGVNLRADAAPAGVFDVVLGAGWPGVLLHEAVGHGLEGDFNRKGSSAFSGKMGEEVASSLCTIVDDGTLPGRRGSLSMDDEGQQTQQTVLIENGRLCGYMFDKLNAGLSGKKSTGNGRRESYSHLPMPRMTNTYMLPGKHLKEEIVASLENGLYALNFNGGQVDITSGKFVFVTSEAYWVKNGKIVKPVKGVTLIGDGPSALKRVSMVGNDLELDLGVGICGKEGQSVPVGVGQPTLRIDGLTVGGSA